LHDLAVISEDDVLDVWSSSVNPVDPAVTL
jgi:hypothetical protein